ncbi:glutamine-hydrolyzing asparagine synthase [Tuber magnatum]|uniref:asparagine synthase (glutamine-hydrolyzing) n=1 Tax=Tuber magnatum TaxID=42249 RepID=A0A317SLH9_9PEZI|nr:glutamine-hydrolyzing asparagine synthase [Tuber magnatum]
MTQGKDSRAPNPPPPSTFFIPPRCTLPTTNKHSLPTPPPPPPSFLRSSLYYKSFAFPPPFSSTGVPPSTNCNQSIMCGIFACHKHPEVHKFKPQALQLAKAVRHRGPDWSGNIISNNTILTHERLSIVGIDSGAQPLVSEDGTIFLAVNGEIYNHRILRKQLKPEVTFRTHSDCEVILHLYPIHGINTPKLLDGMFSFVLYDSKNDRTIAARDPIGITSFYQGWSSKTPGGVYFASELKCLHPVCDKIVSFPPGHIYDSATKKTTRYFEPTWWDPKMVPSSSVDYKLIRTTLEKSVRKRLMAEVPYGVLLSGGLDSSLIASIAARETAKAKAKAGVINGSAIPHELVGIDDEDDSTVTALPQLHSFSIGLPGSPDTIAAKRVAKFLGTVHHEFNFTLQEGLDALRDVIYHLESYDVTTIRASTPMYLLSRKIKALGVKMVLSGEGSDEIFGGYLYFSNAPSKDEFHAETIRRVKHLHLSDCLRANKSTAAWGVEARVPFLDKQFLEVSLNVDPAEKLITKERIEKFILRKAFDTSDDPDAKPYLPDDILWRQKEQFSDGVGYGWIDVLKDTAEKMVSDEQMKSPKPEWGGDVPDSKEGYWYRCMFDEQFPAQCASTVMRWTPKWSKVSDPSGRAISTHIARYDQ